MNQSMSGQSFLSHSSSLPLPTTTNSNGINNGHNSGRNKPNLNKLNEQNI